MSIDEIRSAAFELPPAERASLVRDLIVSLDGANVDDDYEAAWGAEIERRYNEYLRGETVLISAEESIRRAREALAVRRAQRP